MYLMDRMSLGGYTNGADNVLQTVDIGECFCGPSYYKGADGIGRVVSSGAQQVKVWKIATSSTAAPQLVKESESPPITSGQDSGFFTSVTSNGTTAGSQVIWALSRPSRQNPQAIQLYAFDPSAGGGQAMYTRSSATPASGRTATATPTWSRWWRTDMSMSPATSN